MCPPPPPPLAGAAAGAVRGGEGSPFPPSSATRGQSRTAVGIDDGAAIPGDGVHDAWEGTNDVL